MLPGPRSPSLPKAGRLLLAAGSALALLLLGCWDTTGGAGVAVDNAGRELSTCGVTVRVTGFDAEECSARGAGVMGASTSCAGARTVHNSAGSRSY